MFLKSSNIYNHFRKHDHMRPFVCYICDMDFTQSGNLKKHLEKDHPKRAIKINKKPAASVRVSSQSINLGKRLTEATNSVYEPEQKRVKTSEELA